MLQPHAKEEKDSAYGGGGGGGGRYMGGISHVMIRY